MRTPRYASIVSYYNINDGKMINHKNFAILTEKKKGDAMLIIYVREKEAYLEGHLEGSRHLPLSEIQHWAKELDKKEEIGIYCQLGKRSEEAFDYLTKEGFTNLHNLGGIKEAARTTALPLKSGSSPLN